MRRGENPARANHKRGRVAMGYRDKDKRGTERVLKHPTPDQCYCVYMMG